MQVTHVDFLQVLTEGLGVAKGIGSDVGLGHAIYLPDLYRAHARNASFDSAYLSLRCHFDNFLHGALDLVLTEFIGGLSADFVILLTEAALIVTPLAFGLYSVLGCRLYGSSMLVMIFNDEMTFQLNHTVEDIKVDSLQHVTQYTSSLPAYTAAVLYTCAHIGCLHIYLVVFSIQKPDLVFFFCATALPNMSDSEYSLPSITSEQAEFMMDNTDWEAVDDLIKKWKEEEEEEKKKKRVNRPRWRKGVIVVRKKINRPRWRKGTLVVMEE